MSKIVKKAVAENSEAVMYLGPSIRDGLLKNTAMYYGGVLPAYVQELSDNDKNIQSLIVPVSRVAVIQNKLRDKTSLEYARFVKILETYKGA